MCAAIVEPRGGAPWRSIRRHWIGCSRDAIRRFFFQRQPVRRAEEGVGGTCSERGDVRPASAGEGRSSDAFKLCLLAGGRAAPSQPGRRTRFYVRFEAHPKAEVRRRDIVASRRKARKTALFADLRTESSPLEPFRGLLSASRGHAFRSVRRNRQRYLLSLKLFPH